MDLREFYVLWSDQSVESLRLRVPGPFLLLDWPVAAELGSQQLLTLGRNDQGDIAEHLVGRQDKCSLLIKESGVSKRHCYLCRQGETVGAAWTVMDLGSTNGTYVQGVRLRPHRAQALQSGQSLTFGTDVHATYLDLAAIYALFPKVHSSRRAAPVRSETDLLDYGRPIGQNEGLPHASKPESESGAHRAIEQWRLAPARYDDDLHFYLSTSGRPPVRLVEERSCVIGRDQSADLRLDHPQVSRAHAKIFFERGDLFLEDLESINGFVLRETQFNKQRIPLPAGMPFWIGPFKILVTVETATARPNESRVMSRTSIMSPGDGDTGVVFAGGFPSMPLDEVLAGIEFHRRCGTLLIESEESNGKLVFDVGVPIYARAGGTNGSLTGKEAFFRLLEIPSGTFTFLDASSAPASNLEVTITALLAEYRQGLG